MGYGIQIVVSGPRACFTRPEMKAERVSYDVITPSAARGILEAIYWKPAIKWIIDSIEVLNEIRFDTFRRNEISNKLSYQNAKSAMVNDSIIYQNANAEKERQQRATLFLKNVSYVINAHFELINMECKEETEETEEKHYNIIMRRLRKGQCFNQPYLGCREFSASVAAFDNENEIPCSYYRGSGEKDLGYILYDIDFQRNMQPVFFRAIMQNGVIDLKGINKEVIL